MSRRPLVLPIPLRPPWSLGSQGPRELLLSARERRTEKGHLRSPLTLGMTGWCVEALACHLRRGLPSLSLPLASANIALSSRSAPSVRDRTVEHEAAPSWLVGSSLTRSPRHVHVLPPLAGLFRSLGVRWRPART